MSSPNEPRIPAPLGQGVVKQSGAWEEQVKPSKNIRGIRYQSISIGGKDGNRSLKR
jgi:hypothetical protein